MLICHLRFSSYTIHIVLIYRPHSSSITAFFDDLTYIFESFSSDNTIILGDFNIQYNSSNTPASSLKCMLYEFSLTQHKHFPTNTNCNCFDLVISPSSSKLVSSPFQSFIISDHFAVTFELLLPTFEIPRPVSSFRKISAITIIILLDPFVINSIYISGISYLTLSLTILTQLFRILLNYVHLLLNPPIDHIPNLFGLVMS